MKNKILILFGIIFLIGIATGIAIAIGGQFLPRTDTEIGLDKEYKKVLSDMGLKNVEVSEMKCNEVICQFYLYKEGIINKTLQIEQKNYTNEELLEIRNKKIETTLERIAKTKLRDNENY